MAVFWSAVISRAAVPAVLSMTTPGLSCAPTMRRAANASGAGVESAWLAELVPVRVSRRGCVSKMSAMPCWRRVSESSLVATSRYIFMYAASATSSTILPGRVCLAYPSNPRALATSSITLSLFITAR